MQKGLTREQVISGAAALVETEGFTALSLAALARRLQIKTPSLYNHIAGLQDLKNALGCRALQLLYGQIEQASAHDEAERLYAMAEAYCQFVREHPALYAAILQMPTPAPDAFSRASAALLQLVCRQLLPYKLSEEERIHAVRGLRSLAHGFAGLQLSHAFNLPADQSESLRWILTCYLSGLQRQSQAPSGGL
ncbi:MAG: WHG domain-containing protein [Sporolactobacillus sp.]